MAIQQVAVIEMVAGDTLPTLDLHYTLADGVTPVNIAGYTFTLKIARPSTTLTKTATITDAVNGIASFTWANTDLIAGMGQAAQIQMTDASGRVSTYQHLTFNIRAAL